MKDKKVKIDWKIMTFLLTYIFSCFFVEIILVEFDSKSKFYSIKPFDESWLNYIKLFNIKLFKVILSVTSSMLKSWQYFL